MLVAISGTNSSSSDSIHVDLDFLLVPTDSRDFPGGDETGVLLHKGFYEAFGRMRGEIGGVVLAGVGRGVKEIHVVGHSLGKLLQRDSLGSELISRGRSCSDRGDLSTSPDRMGGR
jgi:hypothetical protein